jgi:origin recognition complex subunit 2
MVRRKAPDADESVQTSGRTRRKRNAAEVSNDETLEGDEPQTPSKRRRVSKNVEIEDDEEEEAPEPEAEEPDEEETPKPTPKRRGRPPKTASAANGGGTPSKPAGRTPVKTPTKATTLNGVDTPSRRNLADKSARRKSARALIERVAGDAVSDEEEGDEDIAREIYETSGSEDEEDDVEGEEGPTEAATRSKTASGRKRKAIARKRSPTPPRDLPPHEQYFYQNKPGRAKTSNNDLSALDLLTHDEYFTLIRTQKEPHVEEIEFLQTLHAESFPQWAFELSQGFSICLYGYGSKRSLLHKFATHLYHKTEDRNLSKIVIINGYVRTTSVREIINTIGSAIDPTQKIASGNPVTSVQNLLSLVSSHDTAITLIINSIDATPLRKQGIQSILAQIASHPQIRLVCSTDTPDFPLLWDSGLRSSFNFIFHNCTTFAPFTVEIDVVDEVHELLGRKARRVGGKEGVTFVLRSLPENAKNLFRLLVTEVLVAMDDGSGASAEGQGVEYRMLYNKAVEEFICSSEMAFRTLLKE